MLFSDPYLPNEILLISIAAVLTVFLSLLFFFAIILLFYGVKLYNKIVEKDNQVDQAKGSIETMLKKRHDLIPKIVESVKQYMGYEESTLKEVVELREDTSGQEGVDKERMKKEDQISKDLKQIQVKAEDYPDLKASENFKELQKSLNEVEEQLSASRRFYNSAVKEYHDSIQMFPHSIIAGMFNFLEREYFEAEEEEKQDVNMQGLFQGSGGQKG